MAWEEGNLSKNNQTELYGMNVTIVTFNTRRNVFNHVKVKEGSAKNLVDIQGSGLNQLTLTKFTTEMFQNRTKLTVAHRLP